MTRPSSGKADRQRREAVPSIRDVAAAAGVSYQTVSRVLNESPRVSPDTRRTVLEAIDRLNYRPNRAARALGLGQANAVTVVISDTVLYGYASTLRGVEEAARQTGMAVGIRVIESDRPADVRQTVDYVSSQGAGGVVVIAFDAAGAQVLRELPAGVSAVAATEAGGIPDCERTMIFLDERQATEEATRHLLSLGHRTVHHVAIPSETGRSARQVGWRSALEDAGADVPEIVPVDWAPISAYTAGQRLAADRDVTAILCGNDDTALAVRRALHEAGRDVPGDVSIVGFDDVPGAAYWTPALTTVRMDFIGLGRFCLAALLGESDSDSDSDPDSESDSDPEPGMAPEAPRLIVRESSAPPKRA